MGRTKTPPFDADQKLTQAVLAEVSGRSPQWVAALRKDGFFGDIPNGGSITIGAFLAGVVAYYEAERTRNQASTAANEASRARTEKMQLDMAIKRRDLISLADAEAVVVEFAGQVRAGVAGIPTTASRDPAVRRDIRKACDDVLHQLADRAHEAGIALAPDRRGDEAVSPADARGVGRRE